MQPMYRAEGAEERFLHDIVGRFRIANKATAVRNARRSWRSTSVEKAR